MARRREPSVGAGEDRLLTVQEVAALLALAADTIYGWVETGRLDSVRIGRAVRVRASTIDRLIEAGTVPALRD